MFRDEHGLIMQSNGDCGDSAANEGTYFIGQYTTHLMKHIESNEIPNFADILISKNSLIMALEKLQVGPGEIVRSPSQGPDPKNPWNDPRRMSRDNTTPLLIAAGLIKHPFVKAVTKRQFKRKGFYQNGRDFPNYHVGTFIRANHAWYLAWVMWITDALLIFSVLLKIGWLPRWKHETRKFVRMNQNESDDRNLVLFLIQAKLKYPTIWSWMSRKIYSKFRMKTWGMVDPHYWDEVSNDFEDARESRKWFDWFLERNPGEKNRVMGALLWYFRPQSGGNPEIAESLRPIVEGIFK